MYLILLSISIALMPMGFNVFGADPAEKLLSRTRQITFEGARSGEGYFSRSGQKLVYQSENHAGNPFYQIYLLDLRSGENKIVSSGIGKTTCAWIHPGEKRVLFSSTHLDSNASRKQADELAERESGKARKYSWDYDRHTTTCLKWT